MIDLESAKILITDRIKDLKIILDKTNFKDLSHKSITKQTLELNERILSVFNENNKKN